MPNSHTIGTTLRSLLLAVPLAACIGSAGAEVASKALQCQGQPCTSHWPTIFVPDGWMHDASAEQDLRFQALVPNGRTFLTSGVVILANAYPRQGDLSIDDYLADTQSRSRVTFPNLKQTVRLPDLARPGNRPAFHVIKQGDDDPGLSATTIDQDRDGTQYFVTISLGGQDRTAIVAARDSYLAILQRY